MWKRYSASPPSPQLDLPPMRFMASAKVSWASADSEPCDMAPVEKRLVISVTGSTSSTGMGSFCGTSSSKSRNSVGARSLTKEAKCS